MKAEDLKLVVKEKYGAIAGQSSLLKVDVYKRQIKDTIALF